MIKVPSSPPEHRQSRGRKNLGHNDENLPPTGALDIGRPGICIPSAAKNQKPSPSGSPVRVPLSVRRTEISSTWPNVNEQQAQERLKSKLDWEAQADSALPEAGSSDTGVKVIVRVRPLNRKEQAEAATRIVHVKSSDSVAMCDQHYTFDAIAEENSSQQDVFEMVGLPMVEHCLAGFNSSIFAFGQTGSGKTYTMWGTVNESSSGIHLSGETGLTPKVFEKLFSRMQQKERRGSQQQKHYQCRCSFLEIYNEQIKDLLEPTTKNLQIREDAKMGVYVDNLTEEYVSNMEDLACLLLKGLANRRVGATNMNFESSRSHCVFTCVIECHSKNITDGTNSIKSSRINLVDLAGSERQKQTGAAGERLKEAGNINRSLSQLGNVINILADIAQTGKQRHVPYRDSRLTFLLQESLGGNSKLAMICAISPASSCKNETQSTLRFAQRAKTIQNKAVVNEETATDTNFLREQIRQLKDELRKIKAVSSYGPGNEGWKPYNLLNEKVLTEEDTAAVEAANEPLKDCAYDDGAPAAGATSSDIYQDGTQDENVAAIAASAIGREEAAAMALKQKETEIGELNRLVERYRNELILRKKQDTEYLVKVDTHKVHRDFYSNLETPDLGSTDTLAEKALRFCNELYPFYDLNTPEEWHSEDGYSNIDTEDSSSQISQGPLHATHEEKAEEVDWMSIAKGLQKEVDFYKNQIESERKCSQGLREALEVAMAGHAKVLEQFADLQESHTALLEQHRRIRDGTKQVASRLGVIAAQSMTTLQSQNNPAVDRERQNSGNERQFTTLSGSDDNIQAQEDVLSQLKDANAALARTRISEEQAMQEASRLRHEMEKLRELHRNEMSTLEQGLSAGHSQKLTPCPMCVMAKRVSFQFSDEEGTMEP